MVMCTFLRRTLEEMPFEEVDVASSQAEALQCLEDKYYDLVIVDWVLDNKSGLDIVKSMRSSPLHQWTPIAMITSKNRTEDIIEAMRAGVDDYVVKPMRPSLLKKKVARLLKIPA